MTEENSIGLVQSQTAEFTEPLHLESEGVLNSYSLVYETYGTLNDNKSNAILICHALSSDHHAAGKYKADDTHYGWWENLIGPGKPIDTNRFYIVCCNN